MERVRKCR